MMRSAKININGSNVWCQIFGTGSQPLLMIPGTIGTGTTDFYHQFYGENALNFNEFTIVCIELPGWGRSTPPIRIHSKDVYKNDCECCIKLMQSLGYNKYCVLGWSEGARVGLVLTQNYPNVVEKLILLAVLSFQSEADTKKFIRDDRAVRKWNQKTADNYLREYGERDVVQELWNRAMEFTANFQKYFPNGVTDNKFDAILCPVLIIHGDQDPVVTLEHSLYVMNKVKNAKLKRFPKGSHNLHHKYQREFKQLVENFLLNERQ